MKTATTLILVITLFINVVYGNDNKNKIALIVDGSSSMQGEMRNLKAALRQFIELSPTCNTTIGIYVLGAEVKLDYTDKKEKLLNFIDNLNASGSTAFYKMLKRAYNEADSLSSIVVFTDGKPTDCIDYQIIKTIPIHTIYFGSTEPTKKIFQELSATTNGLYFSSSKSSELDRLFSELATAISASEPNCKLMPANQCPVYQPISDNEAELSGFFVFQDGFAYSDNPFYSANSKMIINLLKKEIVPNCIFFDKNQQLRLLKIDKALNKSEWENGSFVYNKATHNIEIKYTIKNDVYKILLKILSFSENDLILKVEDLNDGELSDDVTIHIVLSKNRCL